MTVPSVGRIVHYVSYGTPVQADGSQAYTAQCRAAVVTEVDSYQPPQPSDEVFVGHVGLCVLNPEGMFFNRSVLQDNEHKGGTWHWPERV